MILVVFPCNMENVCLKCIDEVACKIYDFKFLWQTEMIMYSSLWLDIISVLTIHLKRPYVKKDICQLSLFLLLSWCLFTPLLLRDVNIYLIPILFTPWNLINIFDMSNYQWIFNLSLLTLTCFRILKILRRSVLVHSKVLWYISVLLSSLNFWMYSWNYKLMVVQWEWDTFCLKYQCFCTFSLLHGKFVLK